MKDVKPDGLVVCFLSSTDNSLDLYPYVVNLCYCLGLWQPVLLDLFALRFVLSWIHTVGDFDACFWYDLLALVFVL